MTGTVIQNSLDDLASLIRFLRVPSLDTSGNFRKHIIKSKKTNTTTSEPDYSNLRLLLRSICFGRNASAVLKIPRVSYKTLRPSFSKAERHAYDKLAISCSQSIKAAVNSPSLGKNSSLVLTGVLRLRIFCNTGLSSHVEGISEDIVEYFQPDEMLSLQEQDGQAILTDFENNELIVEDEVRAHNACLLSTLVLTRCEASPWF
jgi:SNF2 family DNA or RNA helicase